MEACKNTTMDDHSFWEGDDEIAGQQDVWLQRMVNATDIVSSMGGASRGTTPLAAERIVEELKNPILDWRTILNDFIQEEICDYSFAPPDKRMEDSPFFLPDFNEKDEKAKDILFMVDTSWSMSDDQITQCYSEIYGAIGQFNGKLQGKLGFFDATVVEPTPFEDEDEFKIIRPKGGGGTSFHIIFEYVEKFMQDELPVSIVILTDGFAPWPAEADALGIPVLWIINNDQANPPWGKVARLPLQLYQFIGQ
jgi:predicted metal-dependent peptidase